MSSYPRTVLVEQEWGWDEEQTDKANDGTRPVDADLFITNKFIMKGRSWTTRTFVNIWVVNNGNTAATADRIEVLAANAEALYMLKRKY
jgi:hypothetical protein